MISVQAIVISIESLQIRRNHNWLKLLTFFFSQTLRLKTGFSDLDRKISGLQPSELIVLASRPAMGKTALAISIAYNISKSWRGETNDNGSVTTKDGGIVGFFSLQMSAEQVATRAISQRSHVPVDIIRQGRIVEKEFEAIRDAAIELQNLPFYIDETAVLSVDQLSSRVRRLKEMRGLDLLIIDNLDLLRSAARTSFGATKTRAFEITRDLKVLAKNLNIAILVLTQLPSSISKRHDKRPTLDEFNDGGRIEQDADVIIVLHRDEYYLANEEPAVGTYEFEKWHSQMELVHGKAELIVAKQRSGPTGTVHLFFDDRSSSFYDVGVFG